MLHGETVGIQLCAYTISWWTWALLCLYFTSYVLELYRGGIGHHYASIVLAMCLRYIVVELDIIMLLLYWLCAYAISWWNWSLLCLYFTSYMLALYRGGIGHYYASIVLAMCLHYIVVELGTIMSVCYYQWLDI